MLIYIIGYGISPNCTMLINRSVLMYIVINTKLKYFAVY